MRLVRDSLGEVLGRNGVLAAPHARIGRGGRGIAPWRFAGIRVVDHGVRAART